MAGQQPLLALPWYSAMPMPPKKPDGLEPRLTVLSQRLLEAFDQGLHCDVDLGFNLGAHRLILRRNPTLLEALNGQQANGAGLGLMLDKDTLRGLVRLHYVEYEEPAKSPSQPCAPGSNGSSAPSPPRAPSPQRPPAPPAPPSALGQMTLGQLQPSFQMLVASLSEEVREAVEKVFGTTGSFAYPWKQLTTCIADPAFSDCVLRVSGGMELKAHRFIVCGVSDAHFFNASLRWPTNGDAHASSYQEVLMPPGVSYEALQALLRLRYGQEDVPLESILEMRHFAELFDWTRERQACESCLEKLLAEAKDMDAESLLNVVTHAEESSSLPLRLKAAALSAALRQWNTVASAAQEALPAARHAELRAMSLVRQRDGHVCDNLEEYLLAAADDLVEWERNMSDDAPKKVRLNLERSWEHWRQLLYEYGHIYGAAQAEKWRERVRQQRERFREERANLASGKMRLPPGRVWFEASHEWNEVAPNAICPAGLEYRFDMQTGKNYARLPL
eukprot:TRINITY_DN22619_c0_g1_i1.p1 TRINITY_DN22619_c0_g1~~TRINITY_DN22619_c0_g1_i1.p1  ORF type:complete len:503 (-),score=109.76 TRINITY_DN22619_c0_g1_i1:190-1698(-)